MAIRSAYVISEEQDGFVAIDFDLISGHDEGDDVLLRDLTAWEFVDQSDADVDDSDDVSEGDEDESGGSDAETIVGEDVEALPEIGFYGEDDDDDDGLSSIGERSYDVSEDFLGGLLVSELLESLSEKVAGGDAVETIAGEDAEETIIGGDAESSMFPAYMSERISGDIDNFTNRYRGGDYEEEEELEEDNYDLDDELVPYNVNCKLGRNRMRKLGKRSCAKLVKSKRLNYNYNKAGCFHGKHGLGLKHSLI